MNIRSIYDINLIIRLYHGILNFNRVKNFKKKILDMNLKIIIIIIKKYYQI